MLANAFQTTSQLSNSQHSNRPQSSYFPHPSIAHPHSVMPTIERLATGTPEYIIPQQQAAQIIANLPHLEQSRDRIEKLYNNTRIHTRHLAVDLRSETTIDRSHRSGTIQSRMDHFKAEAVPLAERVVQQALVGVSIETIGLVVFVTSTGFIAPGVDAELIERLGLRRNIGRLTVNFMGCAAAMNGLRAACDHVKACPHQKALLVCLELSSVNAVFDDDLNDVIIHSIFGDGCAAAIIGSQEVAEARARGQIIIRDHLSYLIEGTQDGITLRIRDNGITCRLSRQLPDYIEAGVGAVIGNFLAERQMTKADIDLWAVHPGGTRIIQKSQSALALTDEQVACSWSVLRDYGNMLSVSILFVLERMLQQHQTVPSSQTATGLAFSFSPGVGVEGMLFEVA